MERMFQEDRPKLRARLRLLVIDQANRDNGWDTDNGE